MVDRVGQQFGNYRLIRSLGSGGFADVYLGEHIYLNMQAAIKILQARLAHNDLQIFLNEARTIANLTQRNIVQVLEFGVEKDTPFLVMTYAPNGTLRQRHPYGSRLSTSEVTSYIRQVADALQYAHERKIIHRDVKPENMLIGQNGDILLSDFGIAVVAQSSRYTGQEVGGTAAYMAPEQLQGRAGPASDQYALAVTAYEWLTGERPFNGSFAEICSQHLLTPPPPLRQKVPSLSPAVEQAVLIALNKDPQRRFANVQAFANALAHASTANQGLNIPVTYATLAEEQISTIAAPPAPVLPPQPVAHVQSNISSSNPPQQPLNTPQLQSWSSPMQSGMTPGQFPPQEPRKQQENKRKKGIPVALIALVVILIVAASAGGFYFFAGKKTLSIGGVGVPHPTATSAQTGATTAPTTAPTSTATTPTGTTGTTAQPVATVASGTITENLLLTCGTNCNDPIQVTITTIQVNDADGNMVWNVSLKDITGTNVGYGIDTFEVLASGTQTQIPATISQSSGSLTNGAPYTTQATFAFVPVQNTTYTLTAVIEENPFMGPRISFEPAQITNL